MLRPRWSIALLVLLATELRAQTGVLLELRPRLGDTVRMRLDQVTEMSGNRRGGAPMQLTTTLRMYSRAIVESRSSNATLILAVTDSIDMSSSDEHAQMLADQAEAQLAGRQMRLRLLPNGTVTLAGAPEDVPREVNELVSIMPASFPVQAVPVGATWMREMPIPDASRFGVVVGGVVRSSFRLDSLSPGGEYAYITMKGTLHPAATVGIDPEALGGSVDGSLVINRRRGWLAESRFNIEMRALIAPRPGGTGAPMRFRMKVTQHMRVFDKRP
jgi:hypothetical protein